VQSSFEYLNADGYGNVEFEEFSQRHALDKSPPPVELHSWYAEVVVGKLQSSS
jgi:hypothetical protein